MSEKRFRLAYEKGNEAIFEDLDHPYPKRLTNKEVERKLNEQQTTIEHLKQRLYDFEKRKIIDESEIDEDVIPKIKLLRTELFGEKYE